MERISKKLKPEDFIINSNIKNYQDLIEESIRKSISNGIDSNLKKVGISLSSGIDSTLVLTLLRKEFPNIEIESISVKFSESIDETNASKKISEKFNTNHHVLEIKNFLEELPKAIGIVKQPFWDLHWYYLVKKMKTLSNVFFSGDGGDELFGGYTFRYKKFLEQITNNQNPNEKIISYLNCHERDWIPEQEKIFGSECPFSWNEIYRILTPYFDNSLSNLTQVFLADYNGKLLHNMQPLYDKLHNQFNIENITPILNKKSILLSCQMHNDLKFNVTTNLGKLPLMNILEKHKVANLVSPNKQGFSVNTVNMWHSYAQNIFFYYFDKSRLVEDKILNKYWIDEYSKKSNLDVRYINKMLGILALEIWYRIFITNEMSSDEKLIKN